MCLPFYFLTKTHIRSESPVLAIFHVLTCVSIQFAVSNVEHILEKLRKATSGKLQDVRAYFARNDPDDTGFVRFEQFRSLLAQVCGASETLAASGSGSGGLQLVAHELISLGRRYAAPGDLQVPLAELAALAQYQMRRKNYDDLDNLKIALAQRDRAKYLLLVDWNEYEPYY